MSSQNNSASITSNNMPSTTISQPKPDSTLSGDIPKTSASSPTLVSNLPSKPEPKSRFDLPNFPDWEGDLHCEYVNDVPNVSGSEKVIQKAIAATSSQPVFLPDSQVDFKRIRSACAVALHMHQPLIPAGGGDLHTAEIISNLKYMWDNQYIGDNHNAPVFH